MAYRVEAPSGDRVDIEDRVSFTPAQRRAVLVAHDGRCAMCRAPLTPDTCEIDHTLARGLGGKHVPANWRPLCPTPCHAIKTDDDKRRIFKAKRLERTRLGLTPPKQRMGSRGFRKDPLRP